MSDKEMIEEMARDIYEQKSYDTSFEGNCKLLAYDLVTLDYRKIPEGSVVLSKEEWAEYVELRNSEVGELVKENRELGKQCLDWMKLYHKQLTKTNEARKQTAKEILDEIMSVGTEDEKWLKNESFVRYVKKMLNKIEEIAKQYGVEV